MTIIASWFNKDENSLWTVSDSRLSNSDGPLFDCGSKIFPLRIVGFQPSENGFINKCVYMHTIGMTFAGSSLLALNLYNSLSYILGNLTMWQAGLSINNIAEYSKKILFHMFREYAMKQRMPALCEISILGYCYVENKYKVFHIYPIWDNEIINFVTHDIDLGIDNFVHLMGDHKDEVKQRIEDDRKKCRDRWWRSPLYVIDNIIEEKLFPETIGGGLQIGITINNEFELFSISKIIDVDTRKGTFYYQNIDLFENGLNSIGNCILNVKALHVEQ